MGHMRTGVCHTLKVWHIYVQCSHQTLLHNEKKQTIPYHALPAAGGHCLANTGIE